MDCGAFDSSFCIHPDGKVSPCCIFDKNLFLDMKDVDWTDPWKDLRDGKGCDLCKNSSEPYKNRFDYLKNNTFAIRHLDIRNNNLCNLECTMCNSYYSSKWAERLGKTKFVKSDFDINLDHVEYIYFAGGEPLLNPKHWELLSSIKNPESVTLMYSSNLTYIDRIEKYWPNFKKVTVNASMDAIGELNDYIRYGTVWNKWEKNLYKVAKFADIRIVVTVSVLNVFYLKDIEEWSEFPIAYNVLTDPQHLCVSVLPQELKDKIEYVPEDSKQLKFLLTKDDSWLFPHTMSYILLQDKIKNTDIWKYLPYEKYAVKEYMKET